jgi:hypothetical protein
MSPRYAVPSDAGGAMIEPSISFNPPQRAGDGRVTAFHWVLEYSGAEAQVWILPTELPRPQAMGDSEMARLEVLRFLEALEEVLLGTHAGYLSPARASKQR